MNNNFANNLKKLRKDNGISQEELAEELGVSRQAVSKWESSNAYPEMDKILLLCDKFKLNIDDLLHKDIRETKGEEEQKSKLNNYVDDFLKFITDTINLFSNMSFKSKIKCILEQVVIGCMLALIFGFIYGVLNYIFGHLLSFLPTKAFHITSNIFESVFIIVTLIICIIIIVHIFKTRYLDYYKKIKKEVKEEIKEDAKDETNKVLFKENENKIVIRDPKHSEYRFITGLSKLIIGIFKCFLLFISLGLIFVLITLFICFALAFLIAKTGAFFIGILGTILSSSIIDIIFILMILNFVFNRKSDKKKMIWSFIISLVVLGISMGLTFNGSLKFKIVDVKDEFLIKETIEMDMNDKYYFMSYPNVEFIESNNQNIIIEYNKNKYCDINKWIDYNNGIHIYTECHNELDIIKEAIKYLNMNKIIRIDSENVSDIKVYTTKANVDKLIKNKTDFDRENESIERDNYERKISILESENNELRNKIYELEEQIDLLKED